MSSVGNVGYRRYNIESRQSWPSPTTLKVMKLIGTIVASSLSYVIGNFMGNARGWHAGHTAGHTAGHIKGYYEGKIAGYDEGFDEGKTFEQEWCAREFIRKCRYTRDGEHIMYPSQPRN